MSKLVNVEELIIKAGKLVPKRIYSPYNIVSINGENSLLKSLQIMGTNKIRVDGIAIKKEQEYIIHYYASIHEVYAHMEYVDFNDMPEDSRVVAVEIMGKGYSGFDYMRYFYPKTICPMTIRDKIVCKNKLVNIEHTQNTLRASLRELENYNAQLNNVQQSYDDWKNENGSTHGYVSTENKIYASNNKWFHPNNLVKFNGGGGKKLYYLKEINAVKGTNEIVITIVKADDNHEYNHVIYKKFSDQYTFVGYNSLTEKEIKDYLNSSTKTFFYDNGFFHHNISKQNEIVNDLIDDMRASLPPKVKVNDLQLKGGESMQHKVDIVIVVNKKKNPKNTPIILEEDPIIGHEEKGLQYSEEYAGGNIAIGVDTATGGDSGQILIHGGSGNYYVNSGIQIHGSWVDPIVKYNGLKTNDKVCINEDNCLILPSKK